jgi:hypothetical protein
VSLDKDRKKLAIGKWGYKSTLLATTGRNIEAINTILELEKQHSSVVFQPCSLQLVAIKEGIYFKPIACSDEDQREEAL